MVAKEPACLEPVKDFCRQGLVQAPLQLPWLGQYQQLPLSPHWVVGRPAALLMEAVVADPALEVVGVAEVEAQEYPAVMTVVSRGGEEAALVPDLEWVQELALGQESPKVLAQERAAILRPSAARLLSSAHWQARCSQPSHLC